MLRAHTASYSHSGVSGQQCRESLPAQYNPVDDTSTTPSSFNTFYLYPHAFNSTQCVGTVSSLQYHFCYKNVRNTGSRPTVFSVLLLRDEGNSYSVLNSFSESEDRSCASTCCKMVPIDINIGVQRDLALGFIVPSNTGGSFLYETTSVTSLGYQTTGSTMFTTTVGGTIAKASLSGDLQLISNLRFNVILETASSVPSLITTQSLIVTTPSLIVTTQSLTTNVVSKRLIIKVASTVNIFFHSLA